MPASAMHLEKGIGGQLAQLKAERGTMQVAGLWPPPPLVGKTVTQKATGRVIPCFLGWACRTRAELFQHGPRHWGETWVLSPPSTSRWTQWFHHPSCRGTLLAFPASLSKPTAHSGEQRVIGSSPLCLPVCLTWPWTERLFNKLLVVVCLVSCLHPSPAHSPRLEG